MVYEHVMWIIKDKRYSITNTLTDIVNCYLFYGLDTKFHLEIYYFGALNRLLSWLTCSQKYLRSCYKVVLDYHPLAKRGGSPTLGLLMLTGAIICKSKTLKG